jgi:dephospho-CoA kinase
MSVQTVKDRPMLIGLTGGIASGKTKASNFFKKLGIKVIDCDLIVKNLWKNNLEMINKAEEHFGFDIKTNEDRKRLSKIIFGDKEEKNYLEKIVHPFVFEEIENQKLSFNNEEMIVIDMPLLIEVGYKKLVDMTCLVYVTLETQTKRLIDRDQISYNDAMMRIASQMPLEEKVKHVDVVFDNNQDEDFLLKQIIEFIKGIRNEE